jgi:drug/metabolite transporter (DMT)-like permease
VSRQTLPSSLPTQAGASLEAPASVRPGPPGWQVWGALWLVYVIWGSTYLGIRVMVETVPPLLGAGVRFTIAGGVLVAAIAARRGARAVRLTRAQLLAGLLVGLLLPGANAVVTLAEQEVPSNLAALIMASIPLWVIVLRRVASEDVSRRSMAAVLIGFAGVALLLVPGEQSGDASVVGLVAIFGAAAMWASGSFASPRLSLPRDQLVSTGWQMLLGGVVITLAGLALGEAGDVEPAALSLRSVLALAYLIVFGSWIGYTAYAWLLQNAPLSKVATYAYVNPVVAIVLGAVILGEVVTGVTVVGAAVIVVSVAMVVRIEAARRPG